MHTLTTYLFPHLLQFIVRYNNLHTTKNDSENQRAIAIIRIKGTGFGK